MGRKLFMRSLLTCTVFCLAALGVFAQGGGTRYSLNCQEQGNPSENYRGRHCEVKEQTLAATGETLNVDGMTNGGISVKGWERNEILVRYRVQTHAPTQAEADSLASQIRLSTAAGRIRAEGPEASRNAQWSVNYEIFVPFQSDLSLRTHNGGIAVNGVTGRINFEAQNGGVSLKRVGGNVTGQTSNGGLSVELSGNRWEGEGLNVQTTNGGLSVSIPESYSANLETGTVNGNFVVSPSIAEVTRDMKKLSVNLGGGGSNLRIFTTNGGVSIKRREAK